VPDKEDAFILVLAASAAVAGYFVSSLFGPQYGLSIGVSAFLLLIGARFYLVEASWSRLLGSLIIAAGAGTFVAAMLGPFAGAVAFLLSLVYFIMRTLLSED
jgi:hypothetical protein